MIGLFIVLGILVVLLLWIVGMYNSLVRLRVQVGVRRRRRLRSGPGGGGRRGRRGLRAVQHPRAPEGFGRRDDPRFGAGTRSGLHAFSAPAAGL